MKIIYKRNDSMQQRKTVQSQSPLQIQRISKCQFSIKRELKEELQDIKITIKVMKCEPEELEKDMKLPKGNHYR